VQFLGGFHGVTSGLDEIDRQYARRPWEFATEQIAENAVPMR
jgi:hypothetical protein